MDEPEGERHRPMAVAEPKREPPATPAPSPLTEDDLHWFNEGTHSHLAQKLGAHPVPQGTQFAVWAPNASSVSVVAAFNEWEKEATPLRSRGPSGIWAGFVPVVGHGAVYKFHVATRGGGSATDRANP